MELNIGFIIILIAVLFIILVMIGYNHSLTMKLDKLKEEQDILRYNWHLEKIYMVCYLAKVYNIDIKPNGEIEVIEEVQIGNTISNN